MSRLPWIALSIFLMPAIAHPADRPREIKTVEQVDLSRYAGTWYEIASIPKFFTKGCECTTAEYTLRPDGKVQVVNSCRKGGPGKSFTNIMGKATVPDAREPGKLKVQFFFFAKGDYWIIALDSDYKFAVVTDSKGDSLWILSRTAEMDPAIYKALLQEIGKQVDTSRLVLTNQKGCPS